MESSESGHESSARSFELNRAAAAAIVGALDAEEERDAAAREGSSESAAVEIQGHLVDACIGRGATGAVYRVLKSPAERPFALKLFHHHLGETPETRRAWREIDVLQQLDVPFVPRLLEHGLHEGRLYIVTEYVRGRSLAELCGDETVELRERVELLARLADVVHSLHERGLIHRDVKPSNILVDDNGRPHVIDLGVAALITDDPVQTLTAEGAPIGSPAYMSPEQARGDRGAISTRSDIYGLGATAYKLLTGQTPHDTAATIHEAIRRVTAEPARDPRSLEPTLPKPLAAVIGKACAARPGDRYASAAELATDLRRWLNREPVTAARPGAYQRLARWIGRHPIASTAAACASLVVLTVAMSFGVVWFLNGRPHSVAVGSTGGTGVGAWARLISASGRTIREWRAEDPDGVAIGELVRRPKKHGGDLVVVLGIRGSIEEPETYGTLNLIDAHDPDRIVWSSGTEAGFDMPEPISFVNTAQNRFRVLSAQLADVFPELEGEEIVATHGHVLHSPSVIRVYDLSGRVLYEVWHDGRVLDVHWLPGPRLIVAAGINSEATWSERGVEGSRRYHSPYVVFAVAPTLGDLHREWIHTPGGHGTHEVAWYRCLGPPERTGEMSLQQHAALDATADRGDPSHSMSVSFTLGAAESGQIFYFVVSGKGEVISREALPHYRENPAAPDIGELDLMALPAVVNREEVDARIRKQYEDAGR